MRGMQQQLGNLGTISAFARTISAFARTISAFAGTISAFAEMGQFAGCTYKNDSKWYIYLCKLF